MIGKKIRLERIMNRETEKTVIVPMDHGVTIGPVPGLINLQETVNAVTNGGANAFVVHKGIAEAGHRRRGKDVGLIIHLSASTRLAPDPDAKTLVCTVEEAIKLGADGVSIHVNLGSEDEKIMLNDLGNVGRIASEWGMPLLAMMYTRGPKVKNEYDVKLVKHAARVGAELGADIVKVVYTGSVDSFREVVEGCFVPVVIAGGEKMSNDEDIVEMVKGAMTAGAAGVSIGRNIFQNKAPEKIVQTISQIVHSHLTEKKGEEARGEEMKKIWVKAIPWNKELVLTALECGVDGLWIPPGMGQQVKKMGIVPTIAEDGDLVLGQDVVIHEIQGKKDEEEILELSRTRKVIVRAKDWRIIPLENLLSRTNNLFLEIKDLQEGQTALTILEKGVDGVVIDHPDPNTVRQMIHTLRGRSKTIQLLRAKIKRIEPLGMGDRVCIDTCSSMTLGEGMLVGNSSQALFLVHSESVENPFVNVRPFRVNAGPVHAYILMANGQTKYLSEVVSGDQVLVVHFDGTAYPSVVGRAKVERRPLILIEAEENGQTVSTILQNAETIRLTAPSGKAVSLVDLKKEDEVLICREEEGGRHFGVKIDETITEK